MYQRVLHAARPSSIQAVGELAERGGQPAIARTARLVPAGDRPGQDVKLKLAQRGVLRVCEEVQQPWVAASYMRLESASAHLPHRTRGQRALKVADRLRVLGV